MAFALQEFPNSDYYDSDLREILRMLRKLEKKYNGCIDEAIKKLIYEKLNDLFIHITYDEPNERLKLYCDSKLFGDGEHIYSSENESIEITEGSEDDGKCCK